MYLSLALSALLCLIFVFPTRGQATQQDRNRRPQQAPFQSVFLVPGVELSEDQQAQVEALRKKYASQLTGIQRNQGLVFTAEQR